MADPLSPEELEAIRAHLDAAVDRDGELYLTTDAPTDLRRLLDRVEQLESGRDLLIAEERMRNAELAQHKAEVALAGRDRTVEVLTERLAAKNAELDRIIREAAADKAKVARRLNVALITIRSCLRTGLQDAELADEAGLARIDEWADFIDHAIRTAVAAPEMPRPPAVEAQERPETPGTGSG